jgi:prolipoprotein diacylglyceryltransferase
MALGLFAALAWIAKRSRRPGETYLAYVAGYSVIRFAVEFLRDDPGRHGFGAAALSDSQIVAIAFAAVAAAAWARLRRSPPAVTSA